jgi:hypothetical protein
MKHLKSSGLFVAGVLSVLVATNAAASVIFNTFVTSTDINSTLGNNATIGFAYAGNKFVGSVYFGTNNNQLYQTDLSGGNVQKFGSPIPNFGGEIFVSSSLGLGGFPTHNVYVGSEMLPTIVQFSNDGSAQSTFATLPNTPTGGLPGTVRGIAFDPYGSYGFDMLVTTNLGNVYRVDSTGTATWLANVGGDAEGLDFAPQQFGNIPGGTLFVLSEGTGHITAIAPNGTKTDLGLVFNTPENLIFVPTNLGASGNPLEGFYAANYPINVQKAAANQFTPYIGDAIVTEEVSHLIYEVAWDSINNAFTRTLIGSYPNQPEDGIFVTAAILNPGCTQTNTCNKVPEPGTLALFGLGVVGLGFARRRRMV